MTTAYHTLYNNVKIPIMGLGTWQLTDKAQCINSVKAALSVGLRLIDTASIYKNESIIGEALSEFEGFSDNIFETANDKGVFLTSKAATTEMGSDETYQAYLKSVEHLKVPKLDLYLLHWPGSSKVDRGNEKNRAIRAEAWKACIKLYNEKKVRAIGVCNYLAHHLEELVEDTKFPPMVNQIELHPFCQNNEMRETAKKFGTIVQAYSSLGTNKPEVMHNSIIESISKTEGKSVPQVLLRWAIQQGLCVIPKTTNIEHMKENIKALDSSMELSKDTMKTLNSIKEHHRVCWNPETVV